MIYCIFVSYFVSHIRFEKKLIIPIVPSSGVIISEGLSHLGASNLGVSSVYHRPNSSGWPPNYRFWSIFGSLPIEKNICFEFEVFANTSNYLYLMRSPKGGCLDAFKWQKKVKFWGRKNIFQGSKKRRGWILDLRKVKRIHTSHTCWKPKKKL